MRETHRSLANRKRKHKLCLLLSIHRRNRKDRQAYSLLLQTTMEPLPHGLWSCSSKPLTGRTGQVEGRFNYWNYIGDITTAWYTGILHRTRTRRKTTCLVGHHSIEATTPATPPAGTTRQTNSEARDSFASRTPLTPTTSVQDTPNTPLLSTGHPHDTD